MRAISRTAWPELLQDPSGLREKLCRTGDTAVSLNRHAGRGQTMVIDKGLGMHAFTDLLETAGHYMDCLKLGFGTAPLYPSELLHNKLQFAKRSGIIVMPGGTLLEAAIQQNVVPAFFETICRLGFSGIEVSDGTIELPRIQRTELIREGVRHGLRVVSEYGKKLSGSMIEADELAFTAEEDWKAGSELVTIEARESGTGVGLFDEDGECREDVLEAICRVIPDTRRIMWEAPLKHQQVLLLDTFGANVHLGNIPPSDALTLETMRRGLRSDTFHLARNIEALHYMI
ncbi:phosphosulfolactate synthase [Paenibacillus oenotherae]|uniref:Phosphosulfolactate synthase n=1 Tax=Paenibacillus oenotherae TaxID=1435645 RepID=A0ABS7D130_9BACL|nr:phosphosulfolactate synthase [Paenibacillus oenotherae]MBW7473563.1 phosphosulfolactate synthase [Paenibacillus oenotherae]